MQFNDTSGYGLIQDFEKAIGAKRGQISGDATLLLEATGLINNRNDRAADIARSSMDGWDFDDVNHADYPILNHNLVANQQDYPLDSDDGILNIKRVEITYDGTNWNKAEPFDINMRGYATDSTSISEDFVTDKPYYDMQYGAIFLYPIPTSNITSGLKIWTYREVDPFLTSDTTKTPTYPRAFHTYLSRGAAYDWAVFKRLDNVRLLKDEVDELESKMKIYYSERVDDDNLIIKPAYINYN